LGSVKIFPDDSRIIPRSTLVAAVRKADILFCLLHDKIDRAVIAANPKLRHMRPQSISPSNVDVPKQPSTAYRSRWSRRDDRGDCGSQLRPDAVGGAAHDGG
jgi:hypothetical protein